LEVRKWQDTFKTPSIPSPLRLGPGLRGKTGVFRHGSNTEGGSALYLKKELKEEFPP